MIGKHSLGNGSGVQVGEQLQWHWFGLTINAATVISTAITAAIVVGCGLYLAATATAKVPSGLQLIFETVIEQIERRVERNLGIRTAPFVVPLAVSLFSSSSSRIGWRSCRTAGNTSDHRLRM